MLLQSATGITKCDNFITKCERDCKVRSSKCDDYYKVRQNRNMYRAFTLTWRTSMQIYWNKQAFTLEKSSPHIVFVWNINMAAVY